MSCWSTQKTMSECKDETAFHRNPSVAVLRRLRAFGSPWSRRNHHECGEAAAIGGRSGGVCVRHARRLQPAGRRAAFQRSVSGSDRHQHHPHRPAHRPTNTAAHGAERRQPSGGDYLARVQLVQRPVHVLRSTRGLTRGPGRLCNSCGVLGAHVLRSARGLLRFSGRAYNSCGVQSMFRGCARTPSRIGGLHMRM